MFSIRVESWPLLLCVFFCELAIPPPAWELGPDLRTLVQHDDSRVKRKMVPYVLFLTLQLLFSVERVFFFRQFFHDSVQFVAIARMHSFDYVFICDQGYQQSACQGRSRRSSRDANISVHFGIVVA